MWHMAWPKGAYKTEQQNDRRGVMATVASLRWPRIVGHSGGGCRLPLQIFKEAQDLLPGGVNSPVRAFKSVGGQPIVFDHVKVRR
jgi:glutamate-1-semialdehyde 2,1-aminomutase